MHPTRSDFPFCLSLIPFRCNPNQCRNVDVPTTYLYQTARMVKQDEFKIMFVHPSPEPSVQFILYSLWPALTYCFSNDFPISPTRGNGKGAQNPFSFKRDDPVAQCVSQLPDLGCLGLGDGTPQRSATTQQPTVGRRNERTVGSI